MTQAYNLSQFANNADANGKISNTALTGLLPIANGGTNNASFGVTAGGVVSTNGSQFVNTGAGTSGQFLRSNGASAPTWATISTSSLVALASTSFTSVTTTNVSGLTLTDYNFIYIAVQYTTSANSTHSIGNSVTPVVAAGTSEASMYIDLNNGVQTGNTSRYTAPLTFNSSNLFLATSTYTKSSTTITFSVSAGTVTGTWQIWGLR